jgi:DNA-binding transcriptional regulator LsrR (DeoR family)
MTGRVKGPASKLTRREILAAAHRFYVDGEKQAAIAKEMGISASYLARLLRRAREQGWVRVFIDADEEDELAAAVKLRWPHLKHVSVVRTGPTPQATAEALAERAARWFDALLDRELGSPEPRVRNIAIGGGMVMRFMVDRVQRRRTSLSVAPTALSTLPGARVDRWTAPIVATLLAERLGLLDAHQGGERGHLLEARCKAPSDSLACLRGWFAGAGEDPVIQELRTFWNDLDVVFLGCVGMGSNYGDVTTRLAELGLSADDLEARGTIGVCANQFFNTRGARVDLASGVPSYEEAMPLHSAREAAGRGSLVVLEAWGALSKPAPALLDGRVANAVFCDSSWCAAVL